MRILKSIAALAVVVSLSGCATLPSHEKMALEVSSFHLPKQGDKDNALIYVVRPSSVGTLIRFNVFLDDKEANSEMGYNRGSQYIYFFVKPGQHTILSKAENWSEQFIDAKAGDVLFFKQEPTMGILMARNDLIRITDVEGKYHVKNTGIGTIIKEMK